jgi:hypothetical protein
LWWELTTARRAPPALGARHPASEKPAEEIASRLPARPAREDVLLSRGVPERQVLVHRAAGELLVPLRHERDGESLAAGNLLGRVLGQDVAVRLVENVAEPGVELLLAGPPLPLRTLHRHAARVERPDDRADDGLLPGPLEDVVVLDVASEGLELRYPFCADS